MLRTIAIFGKATATLRALRAPDGQRVGYLRVSTFDQSESRQLEGVELNRAFLGKASGTNVRRPELDAMLAFVREGDTVLF